MDSVVQGNRPIHHCSTGDSSGVPLPLLHYHRFPSSFDRRRIAAALRAQHLGSSGPRSPRSSSSREQDYSGGSDGVIVQNMGNAPSSDEGNRQLATQTRNIRIGSKMEHERKMHELRIRAQERQLEMVSEMRKQHTS